MTDIVVNIYYLSSEEDPNFQTYKTLSKLGIGLYHSGIELNGVEHSYGGNVNNPDSGVFRVPDRTLANTKCYLFSVLQHGHHKRHKMALRPTETSVSSIQSE